MKYFFISLLYLIIFVKAKKVVFIEDNFTKKGKINGIIHFINCGQADCILIEQNGRFGLIDAGMPYSQATDVVKSTGKGGVNNPDRSVQAVVNYLKYLGVTHLDFVLGTHAHSDHIGGIPQIAYHFVDKKTIYLYKQYRKTKENNEDYFIAAYNSMKIKGAQLIDLTDNQYEFNFGEIHFEFINTNIHKKETKYGENINSIGTIITYHNKKLFLASDLQKEDDLIYKDYIGKIDLLKMSHHGYGDTSFEFLNITRPNITIITNYIFPSLSIIPAAFLQQKVGGKVYYVGGVSTTSENVANSAIRLYLYENVFDTSKETKYSLYIENSGDNYDVGNNINGFKTYQYYTFYFENGKIITGLQEILKDGEKHVFYFKEEGVMAVGWQIIEKDGVENMYYFNKKGFMLFGLQKLEGEQGICQYYFESDGHMIKDACIMLNEKESCFDKIGCYIG